MPFKLSDNSIVMLDADQMIEVGKAVSLHGQRMYAKSWELKALADAATTTEELDAIDINAGWLDSWHLVTLSGMRTERCKPQQFGGASCRDSVYRYVKTGVMPEAYKKKK